MSRPADAQGWVTQPNGNIGYMTSYTTSGVFFCGNVRWVVGSCFASGSSVTLMHKGAGALITFHPTTQSVTAAIRQKTVSLGTLSISYFGNSPRQFPFTNPYVAQLFYFSLNVSIPSSQGSTQPFFYSYWSRAGGLKPGLYNPELDHFIDPSPQGFRTLRFFAPTKPFITTADETIDMTAQVAVAPEPVTIVLLGSGLLGVGGIVRRRRRRESDRIPA
ncbi:MAG: PEP-CTERM sorting domain-containing protein [Gemmatimonadota bacterium]